MSTGSNRGALALLRSALEKTLTANGYDDGRGDNLFKRIDRAAEDGVITSARQKRAHDQIRTLGNDVLHEDWREVEPAEVLSAHHYTQRLIEDFYDDRESVEAILRDKNRIDAADVPAEN